MNINFEKGNGLVPAIIQDATTGQVLMLGYMNAEAMEKTASEKRVYFFSRSKNRLWMKGEESGNVLDLVSIKADCDNDTLLIRVNPHGPVCHTGTDTCWGEKNEATAISFLNELEATIESRKKDLPENSYTAKLLSKGINKVAQKVGEEATELIIEAKDNNPDLFLGEAADLLFHYLILLKAKDFGLADVVKVLQSRKK
jgi:phosphoribosyl-ATP pyrophosphohydrolase/phosphoribosyl-AMP cyclohydrolase